jgi:hypothetical protein
MTNQQIAQRGLEAADILESAVFKDAMAALQRQIIEQWKAGQLQESI